jgi:hypothetical protein
MNFDSPNYNKKFTLNEQDVNGDIEGTVSRELNSKSFNEFLDELKRSCQTDIFIKKTSPGLGPSKIRKSHNIHAYISWFNRLSALVYSDIVKNTSRREKRTILINFFIDVAFECFSRGNFNSAMAIIGITLSEFFCNLFMIILVI